MLEALCAKLIHKQYRLSSGVPTVTCKCSAEHFVSEVVIISEYLPLQTQDSAWIGRPAKCRRTTLSDSEYKTQLCKLENTRAGYHYTEPKPPPDINPRTGCSCVVL